MLNQQEIKTIWHRLSGQVFGLIHCQMRRSEVKLPLKTMHELRSNYTLIFGTRDQKFRISRVFDSRKGEDGTAGEDPEMQTSSFQMNQSGSRSIQDHPRIVVVDDEPHIAKLFTIFLTKAGFNNTKTFSNGKEFLEQVANSRANVGATDELRPDIVILDYRMPGLDGMETAKRLRSLCPRTKIIIITGYELPKESEGLFDAYLNKPISANQLILTVSSLVAS